MATFREKETIFSQGDPGKSVLYLQEGGVKLTVVNFFMNKFKKLGFIRYNAAIHVNKTLLNILLHD